MSTILITGARAPIALDLARSFEAAGHEAHLADSIRPWSVRTLPPARRHNLPPPRFAFAEFAEALTRLVEQVSPRLIVPTCEEVFYVAEAASRRGFAELVLAPRPNVLRRLHSKMEFASLARACGIAAPETQRLTSKADVVRLAAQADGLVFKPEFSRFATRALVRPGPEALESIAPSEATPWVAQRFVGGEETCVWSCARAGELVAFAAYRPRWRMGRSASFYFEADRDPALADMARRIARSVGATGQLSFDVIRGDDGTLSPIECNPRGVSGVHLFDASPRLAKAMLGEMELQTPDADARHLGPAMWLFGGPQALARGRVGDFRSDLGRSRDALAGRRMATLMDAARFAALGFGRGRSASGQSTDDIEWNGDPIG